MSQDAASVIESIGAGLRLGVHELYSVVQLHIAKIGNGRMDMPPEVIPTVLGRGIGQEIVIGFAAILTLTLAEAIDILPDRHGLQLLVSDGDEDLCRVIDKVEVVVALCMPQMDVHIGAGVHGIENFVLNIAKVQASALVQIIHKAEGVVGVSGAGHAVLRGDGVGVIPGGLELLPDLVGIVEGHIPVVGTAHYGGLGLEVIAGLALVKVQIIIDVVIIQVSAALPVSILHILQIGLPNGNIGCILGAGNIDLGIVVRLI